MTVVIGVLSFGNIGPGFGHHASIKDKWVGEKPLKHVAVTCNDLYSCKSSSYRSVPFLAVPFTEKKKYGFRDHWAMLCHHDHSTNKHQLDPHLKTHRSNLGDLEIIYGNLTPVLIHHLSFLCTLLICFNQNECSMIFSFGTIRNWNIHSQIQEDFLPVTTPPNDPTANNCRRHFRWMPPNPP